MSEAQEFWPVECEDGEPDLLVCMSCLSEVFRRKVPVPSCPTCQGVSTFEAFTLDSIREWGSEELIMKAEKAQATPDPPPQANWSPSIEPTD
ncbi:MAG: hypothetical protein ACE5NA_02930 [Nitrospiraceae bacterium]|jgi:hypothetical protein